MFSCAQMWLFNIPIPTFISILFTTRVNGYIFLKKNPSWILFCSNVRQPCAEKKLWEFFKKSKFFPEKCTYLSQISFIKIWTAYLSNWDTVKHWLSFFLWTRWQNERQISECMVIFMSQAVRNVSFTINYFSHQFNHQNVSREKQLALFSGFCFYNNNNNKNRKNVNVVNLIKLYYIIIFF